MSTLLLRLAAPLQSWGVDSKFDRRATGRSPSKSGVVGLCAAAMGLKRNDDKGIAAIAALAFGVRVDREGRLTRDFHMAHGETFWDPDNRSRVNREAKTASAYLTHRYYLADAAFLAGLEGDEALLREIDAAIQAPMYPLYLGRRSCPPEGRVTLGIKPGGLEDTLRAAPPVAAASDAARREDGNTAVIIMDSDKGFDERRDVPISFSHLHRKYDSRRVCEFPVPRGTAGQTAAEHDALAELEA
ncbi:MAG: type I-E CRISPR-associated protein Cas5/CasD [Oscillospiraceae bacterium]|jgi:CRISPR system Cascade subunit CasD|nr:type I-E CRISPR-associated protein Cas5/CasD [Oscillospiraceae bacterium]